MFFSILRHDNNVLAFINRKEGLAMGISVWQLTIIAVIIALLFGTKRLRTLGSDVGTTIKGFKEALSDDSKSIDVTQNRNTK